MAVLLALLSSALWGTADFLGGTASRRIRPLAVVGWSQAFGLLIAVVVCVVTTAFGVDDLRHAAPWAVGAGISGLIGLVCFYAALAAGTMGVVAPIAATGVVVPVLVGVVADGDRPGVLQLAGLAAAIVGVVLASGPELRGAAGARPLLLAAVAAVAFGFSLVFLAGGSDTSTPLTLLVMRGTSVAIALAGAAAFRTLGGARSRDLPLLAVVGAGDVSANLCFGIASTLGLLSLVSVVGSLYPVATVLLALAFHHERLARVQYAGIVAAIAGVALIASGGA